MSQDEFSKLFKYVEEMRGEISARFDTTDQKIDDLTSTVDGLAKQMLDYHQEMLMLAHKVDRMERWIHEIAEKTGVKLKF